MPPYSQYSRLLPSPSSASPVSAVTAGSPPPEQASRQSRPSRSARAFRASPSKHGARTLPMSVGSSARLQPPEASSVPSLGEPSPAQPAKLSRPPETCTARSSDMPPGRASTESRSASSGSAVPDASAAAEPPSGSGRSGPACLQPARDSSIKRVSMTHILRMTAPPQSFCIDCCQFTAGMYQSCIE